MTYELRTLQGSRDIDRALRLRAQVWRGENVALPVDSDGCHRDGDDAAATHFGVLSGDRLVAASRLLFLPTIESLLLPRSSPFDPSRYPGTVCSLSRLVVAPEARGRGLARSLIEWMVIHARKHHVAWAVATSSVPAIEDVLRSIRFDRVADVRVRWGDTWRSEKIFLADVESAACGIRGRAGGRRAASWPCRRGAAHHALDSPSSAEQSGAGERAP